MTIPEVVIWLVVAVVGIPSMWRNPTAAALVLAWFAGQGIYLVTGDNLPVQLYLFPDIVVLAVIFAKPEFCNRQPYRNIWHQLHCVVLERAPADRVVMGIFPLMWLLYLANIHPYYKWHLLWALTLTQFLAAGWEAINTLRRDAVAADEPEPPGLMLVALRRRGYG